MTKYSAVVHAGKTALAQGQHRVVCPVCRGGTDREACLSIWEAGAYVFATCHRANCDVGTVVIHGTVPAARDRPVAIRRSPKQDHSYQLDYESFHQFNDQYDFNFTQDSVWGTVRRTSTAFYFPMYDADGQRKGVVVRPFEPKGPKSLTFADEGYVGVSWYTRHLGVESADVYVVEDPVSAIALYDMGLDAASLNGTALNRERFDAFMARKSRIILMLDADATRKALDFCNRYGPDHIRVVRLSRDVKDMTRKQVQELLDSVN